MSAAVALVNPPEEQELHNYISRDIIPFAQLHYGDTSFGSTGRVMIGFKKPNSGNHVYPMAVRKVTDLTDYLLQMHVSEKIDYYLTCNTIYGTQRIASKLFGLCNIVMDIDGHNILDPEVREETVATFVERCRNELWASGAMPSPNTIVYTGRGVQLWWALVPCYGGTKERKSEKLLANTKRHYDRVKGILSEYVKDLLERHGALRGLEFDDTTTNNAVGYYRLPLTFNTAAKVYGTCERLHSQRYDLRELAKIEPLKKDMFFEPAPPEPAHIPLQDADIKMVQDFASTGFRRLKQLMDLRNLRMAAGKKIDRNYFLFAVYNSMRMHGDDQQALEYVYSFNAGFEVPMTKEEIEGSLCTARKKDGYKYTNERLIEFLSITAEEQRMLHLYPFVGVYDAQKAKPNSTRDTKRKVLKDERDRRILAMHAEGVPQAEIARQLEIGKNTVGRVLKKYNTTENVAEPMAADVDQEQGEASQSQGKRHQNGAIYEIPPNIPPSPVGGRPEGEQLPAAASGGTLAFRETG